TTTRTADAASGAVPP
nr:3-hydroxyphenylacetate 6-hydroxylase, FAD-dependent monooxygenase [Flavobacterium sp., JS-7, Peptide Partial, 15 aa] [Flavobacterium]